MDDAAISATLVALRDVPPLTPGELYALEGNALTRVVLPTSVAASSVALTAAWMDAANLVAGATLVGLARDAKELGLMNERGATSFPVGVVVAGAAWTALGATLSVVDYLSTLPIDLTRLAAETPLPVLAPAASLAVTPAVTPIIPPAVWAQSLVATLPLRAESALKEFVADDAPLPLPRSLAKDDPAVRDELRDVAARLALAESRVSILSAVSTEAVALRSTVASLKKDVAALAATNVDLSREAETMQRVVSAFASMRKTSLSPSDVREFARTVLVLMYERSVAANAEIAPQFRQTKLLELLKQFDEVAPGWDLSGAASASWWPAVSFASLSTIELTSSRLMAVGGTVAAAFLYLSPGGTIATLAQGGWAAVQNAPAIATAGGNLYKAYSESVSPLATAMEAYVPKLGLPGIVARLLPGDPLLSLPTPPLNVLSIAAVFILADSSLNKGRLTGPMVRAMAARVVPGNLVGVVAVAVQAGAAAMSSHVFYVVVRRARDLGVGGSIAVAKVGAERGTEAWNRLPLQTRLAVRRAAVASVVPVAGATAYAAGAPPVAAAVATTLAWTVLALTSFAGRGTRTVAASAASSAPASREELSIADQLYLKALERARLDAQT